jgi:hypothetical protein
MNEDKTEVMIIGPPSKVKQGNHKLLSLGEFMITTTNKARNLGVFFYCNLTFEHQISSVCRSAYLEVRRLSAIRKYLSQDVANKLAVSFILSKLDYCNSIYAGLQEKQLKKLQRVQNCAARVVLKKCMREHVTPMLKELHWLPIKNRIAYKIASLCHRSLNGSAPMYLQDVLHQYAPPRNLRSSNLVLLAEPRYKQERYGRRAFTFQGPLIWNCLPLEIRTTIGLPAFKSKLKTSLL